MASCTDSRSLFPVPGNLFMVSLALADLVVALYPCSLILVAISHNGWALGRVHCKARAFVMGLSIIGSVFTITAINCACYIGRSEAYRRSAGPGTPPSTPAAPGSSPQE